jgi:transcriptional regulator with XRE-family HTH domain
MSPHRASSRELDDLEARIAELAAELRQRRGISQAALAEELGHDQSFVSKVEHRQRRMTVGELLHWAEALGITFAELSRELESVWTELVETQSIWERERRGGRGR